MKLACVPVFVAQQTCLNRGNAQETWFSPNLIQQYHSMSEGEQIDESGTGVPPVGRNLIVFRNIWTHRRDAGATLATMLKWFNWTVLRLTATQ